MNGGKLRITVVGAALAALLVLAAGSVPGVAGTSAPTCFGQQATIYRPDSPIVEGTQKPDVIVTAGAKSQIQGHGGDDLICAGGNKDVVTGNGGNDRISGGPGGDILIGDSGDDQIYGRSGLDVIEGKRGHDVCVGGKGGDLASGKSCEVIRGANTS